VAGLYIVGPTPINPTEIESRVGVEDILESDVDRDYVAGRVSEEVALRATQVYVDTQDSMYAPVSYYTTQDALLVPNAAKGAVNGVATLDGTGKVPAAQIPVLGGGMIKGPWGPNTAFGGSTTTTPFKIAQWDLGVSGVLGQPLVFINTSILSTGGRPVVEVRIGDNTQTTYAAQTLIAQGYGRRYYNDYQCITVFPCTAQLNEGADGVQDSYSPATNLLVNAWMFDADGQTVTTTNASIAAASLFFVRTAL